ncbi:MAG: SBBP repeat-containing protein [Bacteroidetes bacterium]|nr:SBBP repeat-containing protein [Bacteroidota bacterium]
MQWAKKISGPSTEQAWGIAVDASGNVYSAGSFSGTVDFDPGPGTYTMNGGTTGDAYINKLDGAGNFIWSKQLGGTSNDKALDCAVDAAGNIYATGTFSGTADFDPGPGTYTMTSFGSYDVFVVKLDASGNFVWANQMGGTGYDKANSIIIDGSGNVLTTGAFLNTADFDPGPSVYTLTASINSSTFVSKLDPSGIFLLATSIGASPGTTEAYTIRNDATGNVFLSGIITQTVDLDPGPGTYTLASAGQFDAFIMKLDPGLNFLWARKFGSTNWDVPFGMDVDAAGCVYTCGYVELIVDMDPGPGVYTPTQFGAQDYYVNKLDGNGNFIWAKRMGSPGSECGNAVWLDANANLYLTGQFTSTIDFDPGPGVNNMISAGFADIFIHKLDSSGAFVWSKRIGSTSNEHGQDITADPSGNIYLTGIFTSPVVDFDPSPAVFNYSVSGSSDVYVEKFNVCSLPLIGSITGPSVSCFGSGIQSFSVAPVAGAFDYTWTAPGGWTGTSTVNVVNYTPSNNSGSITVNVTDACGTSQTSVFNVTINPTPTIVVSSGTICAGQTFTFVPSGANTYTFSGGSAIVSPSITTSYFVSGTSSLGCVSTSSAVASLTVRPTPTITATNGNICIGSSFTITPGGAASYTFSSGSNIVTPTVNTTYSISGTSAFGCVSNTPAISSISVNPLPVISVNSGTICQGKSFTLTPSGAITYTYSSGSSIVSPIITSSYSVTGSSALGCKSSTPAISNVVVNSAPSISANSGSICTGKSFTIVPSGANTYTISGGNFIVSPSGTSSYSVFGTSVLGCDALVPAISAVTVYSLPILSVYSTNSVICGPPFQGTANLPANGASTYTWNTGDTIDNLPVSPSVTTVYTVTGTSLQGCVNTATVIQYVDPCIGIKEMNTDFKSQIYPNPTNGKLVVVSKTKKHLKVINSIGEVILEKNNIEEKNEIDLSSYANGIYFLKIDETVTKIIKQ